MYNFHFFLQSEYVKDIYTLLSTPHAGHYNLRLTCSHLFFQLFCSQVWVGQAGSAKLQRLESKVGETGLTPSLYNQNDSFVLLIFFDSDGRLQQVSVQ